MPIITSLLDTDWYKITMSNAIIETMHRLGKDMPHVLYKFKCRNKKDLLPFKDQIEKEIKNFQKLRFSVDDLCFIMKSGSLFGLEFPPSLTKMNLHEVSVSVFERDGELNIEIEGPWFPAILFEVPVLSIVNELYFKDKGSKELGQSILFQFLKNVPRFTDFGTRRRYSKKWQEYVFKNAYDLGSGQCTGTSNAMLAKKYNLIPIGTMAHEWLQAFQAISRDIHDFQKDALDHWMLTYRGQLGVALTDIIGIKAFLNDWSPFYAKNYYGLRHDSGDPIDFIEEVHHWYKSKHLDRSLAAPHLLFSDGLDAKKANEIQDYLKKKDYGYSCGFGIGTHFTNNCGVEPLQIVIKLAKLNGQPVVKLSDSPGKTMCEDQEFIKRIQTAFQLKGK